MPVFQFETALVKNLTPHAITLRSGDGDSQDIQANAEAKIDRKFLLWQPPSRTKIRILKEWIKQEPIVEKEDQPEQEKQPELSPESETQLEAQADKNLETDQAAQTP
jgi:hypothetical protein